jgi:ATP-dependent Lhr-like helicase
VDAQDPKRYEVIVEVPVEDMARLGEPTDEMPSGPVAGGPPRRSIWPSIHPRLVELIREHRSTLIFVNSRRLAERLAAAINELAGEELAMAHHGSIAAGARADIEDRLKRGQLPALVATATLELGIDMGAIDLVVQIESPPSVASGIQRFGRSGHRVGETSKGVIFPKYRLDLVSCAAVAEHIREGHVEATRYPRNALDVLAQQIVATAATGRVDVDALLRLVRSSAPYAELSRASFEGVLDLLSGRYPSDDFRELRPRVTWDRLGGTLEARRGARMIAVTSGGTIPDRGLYGVFLAGSEPPARVGELDEEMVFESREGDVFLLGASSWRIEEIEVDRVLVTPAPGEPGRMPFWRGEGPGRPVELGRAIGAMCRELLEDDEDAAHQRLEERHGLDERAARNLLELLAEQREATGAVPSDRAVVLERFVDEMGDERVALLTPFGSPVHAPWAMAVAATLRREHDLDVDVMWSDDGIVFRLTAMDEPPDDRAFVPDPGEVRDLVVDELAGTVLFAARFRENAARALLLPRRRPGRRTPLWLQRRRSADLLRTAADHPEFPVVLETYRECLQDVFDLEGLVDLLAGVRERRVRLVSVSSDRPSPFAASLLFGYVANFLYEGDAPLAERRAHALTLDHAQLMRLLGEPELRELLEEEAVEAVGRRVRRLDGRRPLRDADDAHDLLLDLGDLTLEGVRARTDRPEDVPRWLEALGRARRTVEVRVAGESRWIAAEDAGRYRDALGVVPPGGLPTSFLDPVEHALEDLVARFARTHGPFTAADVAARLGLGVDPVISALERLAERGRVVAGHFLPGGTGHEWCDPGVLRQIKSRSLAVMRSRVEPVEPPVLARFASRWHGLHRPARGPDALLDVVEQLQGAPLPASDLEESVLPSRLADYDPRDLDALGWAGAVVWRGVGSLGSWDGRVALYLRDHYPRLAPEPGRAEGELQDRLRTLLADGGATFFRDLQAGTGAFPPDLAEALWDLVWAGDVTNDTLGPLRSLRASRRSRRRRRRRGRSGGDRREARPETEGRWSLLPSPSDDVSPTERAAALATQLLERHGVLTREAVRSEAIGGGFSAVYGVLKSLEEAGRIRRGYFVEGLGATQFALPGAEERLRRMRDAPDGDEARLVGATDPANPWGAALAWPEGDPPRPRRSAGARVVLVGGELRAWVSRSGARVLTFPPDGARERREALARVATALARLPDLLGRRAILVRSVDGRPPGDSGLAEALREAGFRPGRKGWQLVAAGRGRAEGRRGSRSDEPRSGTGDRGQDRARR